MLNTEMEEFLAQLDELSSDSVSADAQLRIQKSENKKLRSHLVSMKESSKEVLTMYKNERQITIKLQEKLDETNKDLQKLKEQFNELERTDVNKVFHLTELMNEMKHDQAQEHADYIELCKDYFELLSDTTCLYNYEIKKNSQSKIIATTEKFLYKTLGNAYKKPKIIRSKRIKSEEDEVLVTLRSSSRLSKRNASKSKTYSESKKRKTDIWDMKSISQVSSPAETIPFNDEGFDLSSEICEAESSASFNTFSIGNETSFSSLQSQKSSPRSGFECKCHLYPDNEPTLVSIGTNTDQTEEDLPCSVQRLLNDDLEFALNEEVELPVIPQTGKSTAEALETEATSTLESELSIEVSVIPEKPKPSYTTSSTNTEPEVDTKVKETVEQGTSPEPVATSNKSTATVRSSTTRGTSTVNVVTKSCGVQFPEFSIENIFKETIFDLPDIISPILTLDEDLCSIDSRDELKMKSVETMTDLCNVNRELNCSTKSPVKPELSPCDDSSNLQELEDKSFVILGQTLFDLFMKRIRKSNKLSDDEITRQKIWKHLKRQLVDRFSELTFDETLNSSFSDSEMFERIPVDLVKDRDFKCTKEDFQSFVVPDNEIELNESIDAEACDQSLDGLTSEADTEDKKEEDEAVRDILKTNEPLMEPEVFESSTEITPLLLATEQNDLSTEKEEEDEERMLLKNFAEVFESLKVLHSSPPPVVEPIDDLTDVIWSSLFPKDERIVDTSEDCIGEANVLEGFDVEHEPIEIPIENEADDEVMEIFRKPVQIYSEFDSPKSPPPFVQVHNGSVDVPMIPATDSTKRKNRAAVSNSILDFDPQIKKDLKTWQSRQKISCNAGDKELFRTRRAFKTYLDAEWTDENLDICLNTLADQSEIVIMESLYETVEDFKSEIEVNTEFTPPAPPLPRYQQKLILLIKKLSDRNLKLPHLLVENLEEKLFRLDSFTKPIEDLRNLAYYYSALVDLFFDGDSTTVLYFIVKCIYFFGFKSVPMVFVLLKAFPESLPKKSQLLKMYSKDIDWENMSGLELSKVHLNLEWMDSLDLTVIYVLIFIQNNGTRKEKELIGNHELYPFIQKYYGFFLNLMTPQKLMEILMKRLEEGQLKNFSLSMILLAKRSKPEFTLKMLVRENLIPTLSKHLEEANRSSENIQTLLVSKICALIESITAIIKAFPDEKDLSFRQVFPMLISTISRIKNKKIQEHCIKAILRLHRFMTNHKDIYSIIKHHVENVNGRMSDGLIFAIQTFIHRKSQDFFKEIT